LISLTDSATETFDLRGATVLPGLIDTHPHLCILPRERPSVDVSDAISHDEIVSRIAARAQTTPELPTWKTLDRATSRPPRGQDIGSLKAGHHADLIVVDRDPVTCTVDALGGIQVLRTMSAGGIVYDAGAL
jgi:predicted amidohydrolase YtcJ